MPLQKALQKGIRAMMGSDIGAGRSFSIPITTGRAYDTSLLLQAPVSPEKLLYQACVAARIHIGIDKEADFSVFPIPNHNNKKDIIDALLFQHDNRNALATYVRGKKLRSSADETIVY